MGLVFDKLGQRLLMGGVYQHGKRTPAARARLWNAATGEIELVSQQIKPGPVGFLEDGSPVQVVPQGPHELLLWDIRKQQQLQFFRLDVPADQGANWEWLDYSDPQNHPQGPLVVMTPDASRVAAAASAARGNGRVVVWDGTTGQRLAQFDRTVQALALSPNEHHLAMGDDQGRITISSVDPREKDVTIRATRMEILCLAFSPDNQLLAVGDSAGVITLWDWRTERPRRELLGASNQVLVLAFNSDGTLLAGGGRGHNIWDVASGNLLLKLETGDYLCALAFSLDGHRLASANLEKWGPASIRVWDLQHDRGIQTMRGLGDRVEKVCFSPDGKLLAALSQRWELSIWEIETARLLRKLDVPRGEFAGNCAVAFSRDNRHLAVASLTEAKMWDLDIGKEQSWTLPFGVAVHCSSAAAAVSFYHEGS